MLASEQGQEDCLRLLIAAGTNNLEQEENEVREGMQVVWVRACVRVCLFSLRLATSHCVFAASYFKRTRAKIPIVS